MVRGEVDETQLDGDEVIGYVKCFARFLNKNEQNEDGA